MNIKQSFALAIKSLMGSKMRSFLTMLGIIIGVGSVIILVSVMDGMNQKTIAQFESMGTNLISISIRGRGGNRSIKPEQMQTLVDENPEEIAAISPNVTIGNITVKVGNDNTTTSCYGVNEQYMEIKNFELSRGRFLQYIDVERRQKNCVVGSYIAKYFFAGENPIGQQIKIGGNYYNIIGVLEETNDSEEDTNDDQIILPYTLARSLTWAGTVSSYVMSAKTTETLDKATELAENLLLKTFANSNYYSVFRQSDMIDMVEETSGTMTMVMVGVAAISLLVGGIGIMNIMLVSVTERTREIGIRKSLGAKRRDIMSQFVVEAATTSSIGGILGVIFGIVASYFTCVFMDFEPVISIASVLIAFSVSAFIGIIFGYFPASKASKLNPIEALRYD